MDRLQPGCRRAVTALAGVHAGCFELFAHEPIRTVRDLKGKRVGVQDLGSSGHLYLAVMAAYVGLDPRDDIDWVTSRRARSTELFADGKSTRFSDFLPSPRSCAPAASAA